MRSCPHVRLDEINPGQWFAKQFSEALGADKTLIQKSGYFARSAKPGLRDLDLIKKSAFMAAEMGLKGKSGFTKDDMIKMICDIRSVTAPDIVDKMFSCINSQDLTKK